MQAAYFCREGLEEGLFEQLRPGGPFYDYEI